MRDTIQVKSVRTRWLEPGFGYVRVAQFQVNTGNQFAAALQKMVDEQELKGLAIDLRNNPGGRARSELWKSPTQSWMAALWFIPKEGWTTPTCVMRLSPGDITNNVPIVVLINEGSASASEIVAGALQDHRRAIIMGTDSFGKGSVQRVFPIDDVRAIKMTTALYFTPGGRSIQALGIEPDIVVERAKITPSRSRS